MANQSGQLEFDTARLWGVQSMAGEEQRAVREPKSLWVAGGAIAAAATIGGMLLAWGLESLVPALGVPSSVWVLVGLLPLYCLWRKFAARAALEPRQIGLIIVAVIALDAAFDAVLWGAKAALITAAVVLIVAARRRSAAARQS
jgi:hypothetical protein